MKSLLDRVDLTLNPPELGCVLSLTGLPGGSNRVHDRSPYGNTAVRVGASWVRLPGGLWCLSFDGNDDLIDCGNHASLYSDNGTWLTWVKGAASAFQVLFSTDAVGSNAGDAALLIDTVTSKFRFWMHDGVDQYNIYGNAGNVTDGSTPFLVGINFGNAGMKMYVNGVKQDDTDAYIGGTAANQNMIVGNWRPGGTNAINGWLALPRIFNRPLTDLMHQNIFNRTKHLFGVW